MPWHPIAFGRSSYWSCMVVQYVFQTDSCVGKSCCLILVKLIPMLSSSALTARTVWRFLGTFGENFWSAGWDYLSVKTPTVCLRYWSNMIYHEFHEPRSMDWIGKNQLILPLATVCLGSCYLVQCICADLFFKHFSRVADIVRQDRSICALTELSLNSYWTLTEVLLNSKSSKCMLNLLERSKCTCLTSSWVLTP